MTEDGPNNCVWMRELWPTILSTCCNTCRPKVKEGGGYEVPERIDEKV